MQEIVVIGGGVAGAAAAAFLAQAGRPVVLIERTRGPHDKVCGEFISAEAAYYLRELDVDLRQLGAVPITTVRTYAKDRVAAARLPFPALSVSRRMLDEALLSAAAALGAEIRRGSAVRSLQRREPGWLVELDSGKAFFAGDVFLATGKHDLRGWKRPAGSQNDLVAFKLHWRLSPRQTAAVSDGVELFLFPGGYAGLEPIERGIANLCLVVRQSHFGRLGKTWHSLLAALRSACPPLDERLAGATPCWERPLAIASIPYGYMAAPTRGPWLLGDQAAVIPSLTGDGIAIALHSAWLAARYHLAGGNAGECQARLRDDVAGQVRRATVLSQLLVRSTGRAIAAAAVRIMPDCLGVIARGTRIPARHIGTTPSASPTANVTWTA